MLWAQCSKICASVQFPTTVTCENSRRSTSATISLQLERRTVRGTDGELMRATFHSHLACLAERRKTVWSFPAKERLRRLHCRSPKSRAGRGDAGGNAD